jgi:hypothetical protein
MRLQSRAGWDLPCPVACLSCCCSVLFSALCSLALCSACCFHSCVCVCVWSPFPFLSFPFFFSVENRSVCGKLFSKMFQKIWYGCPDFSFRVSIKISHTTTKFHSKNMGPTGPAAPANSHLSYFQHIHRTPQTPKL